MADEISRQFNSMMLTMDNESFLPCSISLETSYNPRAMHFTIANVCPKIAKFWICDYSPRKTYGRNLKFKNGNAVSHESV